MDRDALHSQLAAAVRAIVHVSRAPGRSPVSEIAPPQARRRWQVWRGAGVAGRRRDRRRRSSSGWSRPGPE